MHASEKDDALLAKAEMRIAALEKKVAVLQSQLAERAESLPPLLSKLYHREEKPVAAGGDEAVVDLILPVRNTYDYLVPCVESIFKNTDIPFRLFVNDNASTDPRTPQYLRQIRDQHPERVRLFLQENNIGVTDALNVLLAETSHDVIMVNADTVMPPAWASRMLWPIRHSGKRVGATSPFSNSSVFTSFPFLMRTNELFESMELDELDRVFQLVKPTAEFVLPYAPGFCMAFSRQALDAIGTLDAPRYRPGYGEESDWCYRARQAGFESILVPNLFVFHKEGVTMKDDKSVDRDRLIQRAARLMLERFPNFQNDIYDFSDNPAYRAFHSFLVMFACLAKAGTSTAIFENMDRVENWPAERLAAARNRPILAIGQSAENGIFTVVCRYKDYVCRFTSPTINWVVKLLYRARITEVQVEQRPPLVEEKSFEMTLAQMEQRLVERVIRPTT